MNYGDAISRLQEADDKGDLLGSLRAQKSAIISMLSEAEAKDVPSLMSSLSRTTADLIKQEGLSREVSDREKEEMTDEDALRRVLGVGGIGVGG